MLNWTDLPRRNDLLLPAEFRKCEGWFETVGTTESPDTQFAVFSAGHYFHPSYIILFDREGRPLCYVQCDPDVCPLDPDRKSMAFFDWNTNTVGHLIFESRELRTLARGPNERVTGVSRLRSDGSAMISVLDFQAEDANGSTEREIESRPGDRTEVPFHCAVCGFRASIPYGGVIPTYSKFKFIGCRACSTVSQVSVDVRAISQPNCSCGAKGELYDDVNCRWVELEYNGGKVAARRFPCPSCGAVELIMNETRADSMTTDRNDRSDD